jgi:stage II sporulation protein P
MLIISVVFSRRKFLIMAGLILFMLASTNISAMAVIDGLKQSALKIPDLVLNLGYRQEPAQVLHSAMPVMAWSNPEVTGRAYDRDDRILWVVKALTGVDPDGPPALVLAQLPSQPVPVIVPEIINVSRSAVERKLPLSEDYLVVIINTHTAETYALTDQKDRLEQHRGGVVLVAAALEEALEEKHGIKTNRSDRIHDANYSNAYRESGKTVAELLAAAPRARIVFDIHRDAGVTREQSMVTINGKDMATLLFVISAGNKANIAFAKELSENINKAYPGLSLGVRIKNSNYNQHLHPQMVLLEVGSTNNTLDEAIGSAVVLAEVVAGMLHDLD